LLEEAVLLKREVPSRSVNRMIEILEMEGKAPYGVLSRSTLQRHLQKRGYGKKQMKLYASAKNTSSRRFEKPHRCMLWQGDIKYGLKLPIGKHGVKVQTYLSTFIDDHSRYVVSSGFYANQEAFIVEDTLRKAVLNYGKTDAIYVDRGKQYVSHDLIKACARLGIRHLKCKPYKCESKGKIEKFNQFADIFLDEAKAAKVKTLDELNDLWEVWLSSYYHEKPHEALGTGVSPQMEWNRDSRNLVFLDASAVAEAFVHRETRKVDKSGCISFQNRKYEVSLGLIGASVEIAYDPAAPDTLLVYYQDREPIAVKPLQIGEFCAKSPKIPEHLLPKEPETSRFLDGLKEKHTQRQEQLRSAIFYGSYRKGANDDV